MDRAAIDRIRDVVLASAPRGRPSPASVTFLLRDYVAGGDAAVRVTAEEGLTLGLELLGRERDPSTRVLWLRALAEAASCAAGGELSGLVERELPDAIDDLESHVRRAYEPGDGLAGATVSAQVSCALALLAAFDLTGRLPYAMLAEELLMTIRRQRWDPGPGRYHEGPATNAVAASVCCRLAALHADADYVARAAVAPRSTCRDDARLLLAAVAAEWPDHPEAAAEYGVALFEWFALEAILQ